MKVACDLFVDLKLYHLPQDHLNHLKKKFPNIEFETVNLKQGQPAPSIETEIYWGNRITPEIISSMPNLKWIHFGSVGVNKAQTQEVLDRKILVTNSKDIMTGAVASTALAMMLSLARGLHHCWKLRTEGTLSRETYDQFFDQTFELENQTCLILGYGQIGKRVAAACKALGMNVNIVARSNKAPAEINGKAYPLSELKTAVAEADYVINILPLTEETTRIFDKAIFKSMKPSAFFVNVGRGESVNENDLIEALKSKTIAGAGLDVFEKEPLSKNSELWTIPEAIITPHIGGLTNRYWEKETKLFEENLQRFLNGGELINIVDMKKGY